MIASVTEVCPIVEHKGYIPVMFKNKGGICPPLNMSLVKKGTGISRKGQLAIFFFKLDSWSTGAGFFPIATTNFLSLQRRRDSDFKNNVIIMKRER